MLNYVSSSYFAFSPLLHHSFQCSCNAMPLFRKECVFWFLVNLPSGICWNLYDIQLVVYDRHCIHSIFRSVITFSTIIFSTHEKQEIFECSTISLLGLRKSLAQFLVLYPRYTISLFLWYYCWTGVGAENFSSSGLHLKSKAQVFSSLRSLNLSAVSIFPITPQGHNLEKEILRISSHRY